MTDADVRPQILVAQHKHGDTYYIVNSAQDMLYAKAQMIRDWDRNQMFYAPDEPYIRTQDAEIGVLSDEEIAALPEAFRASALTARRSILSAQAAHARDLEAYALLQEFLSADSLEDALALKSPRGTPLVNWLVDQHGGGEYMEWDTMYARDLTAWK